MRLEHATWLEVEAYLTQKSGIILPTGSTEQHGPMGLIGTDSICAEAIATAAGKEARAYVAPTLAYTPAPFNTSFPGTVSVSPELFKSMAREIFESLIDQGFLHIYVLNGHGANVELLKEVAAETPSAYVRVRSWWDFRRVNRIRRRLYEDWEGMHATPSEVSITQALHRVVPPGIAAKPPERLSEDFIKAHAGDKHGPPDEHRTAFPDGRVGSHSALAQPDHGKELLDAAGAAVAKDYLKFLDDPSD